MWQRIQTVFLAIAILSLVTSIILPIWGFHDPSTSKTHQLFAMHYMVKEPGTNGEAITSTYFPYSLTIVLMVAAITIAAIEIKSFKNRMLQMKLGALNSVFMAASIGSAVYFSSELLKTFQGGQYGLGLWLPGIAVICNLLANFFIRKDERLVRDSDRLR